MAISIVGTASAAATSITIPAHQSGDVILLFAHASTAGSVPSAPAASGNVPTWTSLGTSGTTNYSNHRLSWCTGTGSTTSGTWAGGTDGLIVAVLRGAASIGGKASGAVIANTTNVAPAVTLSVSDGTSALLHFFGYGDAVNLVGTVSTSPTGYTRQLGSAVTTRIGLVLLTKDSTTSDGSVTQSMSGVAWSSAASVEVVASAGSTTTLTPAGATAIAITGTAPKLDNALTTSGSTVSVTGTAPSLVTESVLTPAAASATVTGTAPTLDLIVTPPGGSLTGALITVTGSAPTLTMSLVTTGDTITITGGTPSTAGTAILTPASATITVTGSAPKLLASLFPGSQTLPVTGGTPALISVTVLSPAAGAATVTGGTPVVINPITLRPSAATITITGSATTITVAVYYAPAPDPQHTAVLRHEERTHVMFGERIHSVRRASRLTEA